MIGKSHYKSTGVVRTKLGFLPKGLPEASFVICSCAANYSPSSALEEPVRDVGYDVRYNTSIGGEDYPGRIYRQQTTGFRQEAYLIPSDQQYIEDFLVPILCRSERTNFILLPDWVDAVSQPSIETFFKNIVAETSKVHTRILPTMDILLLLGHLISKHVENRHYHLLETLRLRDQYRSDQCKSKKFKHIKYKKYLQGRKKYKIGFEESVLDSYSAGAEPPPALDAHTITTLTNLFVFDDIIKTYEYRELVGIMIKDRQFGWSLDIPLPLTVKEVMTMILLLLYNKDHSNPKGRAHLSALKNLHSLPKYSFYEPDNYFSYFSGDYSCMEHYVGSSNLTDAQNRSMDSCIEVCMNYFHRIDRALFYKGRSSSSIRSSLLANSEHAKSIYP